MQKPKSTMEEQKLRLEKIFQKTFEKPLDKPPLLWYNIDVKGKRARMAIGNLCAKDKTETTLCLLNP